MATFEFNLATPADDDQLRCLMSDVGMEGAMQVCFPREPSFFQASCVHGTKVQTLVMRPRFSNRIVGMGIRSIKPVFINGESRMVGYLGSLRLLPEFRKAAGLAQGYHYLRQCHVEDGQVPFYLTTVVEDNHTARRVLESGRYGLPTYHDVGGFCTYAINPKTRIRCVSSLQVRRANLADVQPILDFLHRQGRAKQFFPVYTREDFEGSSGQLHGLNVEDLFLALDGHELVGVTGLWDQRGFRQTMVMGYRRPIAFWRPLINGWARVRGAPCLPATHEVLNLRYLACICVRENDPDIFTHLLATVCRVSRGQVDLLMAGFHERDSLGGVVAACPHVSYRSRLYQVYWQGDEPLEESSSDRIAYLELGGL